MVYTLREPPFGGSINALDIVAYVGCYLIYFAVYLAAILAIYWFVWNVRRKNRETLGLEKSK